MTQSHISESEKKLKHSWKPVEDENGVFTVPGVFMAVQTDSEVKSESDPTCSSAGCMYNADRGKTPYPMNYFVPNFGRDRDINTSDQSLSWAEKKLNHKWIPKDKPKPLEPILYDDGSNKPLEGDIQTSLANLKSQEKKLGTWKIPLPPTI
jgi:hypothetical protein